jgi:hypothetical protein
MRRLSRSVRQQCRIDAPDVVIRQAGNVDRPLPRQRHPRRRARLCFIARPEDVVNDRDASACGDNDRLRSQGRERRRLQVPHRHADGTAPIPFDCHRLHFGGEQACDRAALQSGERPGGMAMAPLIRVRPGFGKTLVAPFDVEAGTQETLYLVSRTEQARDARIAALRRWIGKAVDVAIGGASR